MRGSLQVLNSLFYFPVPVCTYALMCVDAWPVILDDRLQCHIAAELLNPILEHVRVSDTSS